MSAPVDLDGDPPGVRRVDAVLVAGPAAAGVTSLIGQLRRRMPARRFVEAREMAAGDAPTAVVFVVSAVAPMVESDCALADLATAHTDAVVAVVAKTDDHRAWRGVLAANRECLAGHAARFADVPWVGAAPAPRLGEPHIDGVVGSLEHRLADPLLVRRNTLRAWQAHVGAAVGAAEAERELLRGHRLTRADGAAAVRHRVQQARLELIYAARRRCAALRTEMGSEVAAATRRTLHDVEARIGQRCRWTVAEADADLDVRVGELTSRFGGGDVPPPPPRPVAVPDPPARPRRLETQLMIVLGAGFGCGVTLAVARLLADLTAPGFAAGALAGLAVTVWVVRARGLLHDRAILDRWVGDTTAGLRSALEERVAVRLLAVEGALLTASSRSVTGPAAQADLRLTQLDAELRRWASVRRALEAAATDSVVTGR